MTTMTKEAAGLKYTDKYFTNVRRALAFHDMNPIVTYRVFMRVDAMLIGKFIQEYVHKNIPGAKLQFLHNEGRIVHAKEPLFEITGKFQDIVEHETAILWYTGWPALCAYNAYTIKGAVREALPNRIVNLVDMSARHCPGPEAVEMASYAAHVGGFDACSTDLGAETFGGHGVGTMPHAWIWAFPSTAEAAVAFAEAFPETKISVLVDYYGQELEDAAACVRELGDRLNAVRIDTHGGRYCQGVTNTESDGDFAAITRLRNDFGVDFAGRFSNYAFGKGVTVEAAYCLRRALDEAGGKSVKITVSSGFTAEKVDAFMALRAPVDTIGTGSFLPTDIRDTYATMDIVSYDGKPKIKVGREWLLG